MNRTDARLRMSSAPDMTTAGNVPVTGLRRLAVVLFEVDEEALLARQIRDVVKVRELSVLLIGVAPDPAGEAQLRRKLARIAAFLDDQNSRATRTQVRMEVGKDWIGGIEAFLYRDDMLACYAEQTVGVRERPLCDVLSSDLHLPIYTFSGLQGPRPHRRNYVLQIVSWLFSLASLGGFFVLQARIVTVMQGWTQSVLMLIVLLAEAGLLWLINSLLAQS